MFDSHTQQMLKVVMTRSGRVDCKVRKKKKFDCLIANISDGTKKKKPRDVVEINTSEEEQLIFFSRSVSNCQISRMYNSNFSSCVMLYVPLPVFVCFLLHFFSTHLCYVSKSHPKHLSPRFPLTCQFSSHISAFLVCFVASHFLTSFCLSFRILDFAVALKLAFCSGYQPA